MRLKKDVITFELGVDFQIGLDHLDVLPCNFLLLPRLINIFYRLASETIAQTLKDSIVGQNGDVSKPGENHRNWE